MIIYINRVYNIAEIILFFEKNYTLRNDPYFEDSYYNNILTYEFSYSNFLQI